jgi:hypothetical protein
VHQAPKKPYSPPSLKSFRTPEEVLAWAASRGNPEDRERAAELVEEMKRMQPSFDSMSARRRAGR